MSLYNSYSADYAPSNTRMLKRQIYRSTRWWVSAHYTSKAAHIYSLNYVMLFVYFIPLFPTSIIPTFIPTVTDLSAIVIICLVWFNVHTLTLVLVVLDCHLAVFSNTTSVFLNWLDLAEATLSWFTYMFDPKCPTVMH